MTQDETALSANVNALNRTIDRDAWILDHGAMKHLCYNRLPFCDHVGITPSEITTAGGITKAIGKGTVRIRLHSRSADTRIARLSNVLYVPGLSVNLISHSTLEEKGVVYDPYARELQLSKTRQCISDVGLLSGLP